MRHAGDTPGRLVVDALLDAWALLQPIECLGCGLPDRAWCRTCRAAMRPEAPRAVRCDASPGVSVWGAADYEGPVRGAVLALKEHGRVDAARALAPLLRAAVTGALGAVAAAPPAAGSIRRVELAPIPSTRRALVRRGHDPVRLIVARAGLPASRVIVPRRAWTAGEQKRRTRAERLAARPGGFRARMRLDGRAFLVLDDLATTGATLASACAAIRAAGGVVLACAVAAVPDLAARSDPAAGTTGAG